MGKNTQIRLYIYFIYVYTIFILVEMRNTCQVTNQSSHGELSFHHNPHLRLCWGLGLFTSRVVRSGGSRLKNAALPTYCHCCEFCALKQKPGVLLENTKTPSVMCRASFFRLCVRCCMCVCCAVFLPPLSVLNAELVGWKSSHTHTHITHTHKRVWNCAHGLHGCLNV